jgi:hypothetical protein
MPLTEQQITNINGETMVLYIPRVHKKHSTRDIRTKLIGLGLGENINIDIAHNPSTGFNMVFVFFDMNGEIPNNLEILKTCLSNGQDIRIFPDQELSREFWMILPSNADHALDEEEQIQSENLKVKIQLDSCFTPVNSLNFTNISIATSYAPELTRSQNRHFTPEEKQHCRETYAEKFANPNGDANNWFR